MHVYHELQSLMPCLQLQGIASSLQESNAIAHIAVPPTHSNVLGGTAWAHEL